MKNRNPKMVIMVGQGDVILQCKKCRQIWSIVKSRSDEKVSKDKWQCPNGCKAD